MFSGAPLSYQWRKDGNNIPGATSSLYTITNAQNSDAGSYSVVIGNSYTSVVSSNALLTLSSFPPWPTRGRGLRTVIGQFHHAIKCVVHAADMEDRDQVRMVARERFIFLDALELAAERAVLTESGATHNLYRAKRAEADVPCKPDLAVSATTNHAEDFVVRDLWPRRANWFGSMGVMKLVVHRQGIIYRLWGAEQALQSVKKPWNEQWRG